MKRFIILALISTSAFAAPIKDSRCSTLVGASKSMEVIFEDGELSYDDGRLISVQVSSKKNDGKIQTISGVSRGLIFAGGGTQSVSVKVNLRTKKGEIIISTKTFYRSSVETQKLSCTI